MQWLKKFYDNTPETARALKQMREEIDRVGGNLTFEITLREDGWDAVCREFDGIVAGGTNPFPTEKEMQDSIMKAVHVAFNVPVAEHEEQPIVGLSNQFVRKLELCPA